MPTERFEVVGRVQGVGFRWFARERARALELEGWVRNLPSGNVELLARGSAAQLDRLEDELRRGPPGSRVESVMRSAIAGEADLSAPFSIAR